MQPGSQSLPSRFDTTSVGNGEPQMKIRGRTTELGESSREAKGDSSELAIGAYFPS